MRNMVREVGDENIPEPLFKVLFVLNRKRTMQNK